MEPEAVAVDKTTLRIIWTTRKGLKLNLEKMYVNI